MKYHIIITNIKSVQELPNAWSTEDYIQLLERFGVDDTQNLKPEEVLELLFMAMSDFEPKEAASIVLNFKLSRHLKSNQIEQVSNDMLENKISEEYADISLHHQLFNINQLLYKAYNGTFPNAKATIIEFEIEQLDKNKKEVSKEIALKCFNAALSNNNVIKRLFSEQLAGKKEFKEAEHIVWQLKNNNTNSYSLITSDYWIGKEELLEAEFDANITQFEEDIKESFLKK